MDTPNNHYKNCVIEPIEIIEKTLTAEQYKGYQTGDTLHNFKLFVLYFGILFFVICLSRTNIDLCLACEYADG